MGKQLPVVYTRQTHSREKESFTQRNRVFIFNAAKIYMLLSCCMNLNFSLSTSHSIKHAYETNTQWFETFQSNSMHFPFWSLNDIAVKSSANKDILTNIFEQKKIAKHVSVTAAKIHIKFAFNNHTLKNKLLKKCVTLCTNVERVQRSGLSEIAIEFQ